MTVGNFPKNALDVADMITMMINSELHFWMEFPNVASFVMNVKQRFKMQIEIKNGGAINTPHLDNTDDPHATTALRGLQEIRQVALYLATKYRWDPILGHAHDQYLDMINTVLKECEI